MRKLCLLFLLALAGCHSFVGEPSGHGPQWVQRPAGHLVDKMGKPDRVVHLPPPSLSSVFLYTGGAVPGYAACERLYFVRGESVIGYSEHGTAPGCDRHAGITE